MQRGAEGIRPRRKQYSAMKLCKTLFSKTTLRVFACLAVGVFSNCIRIQAQEPFPGKTAFNPFRVTFTRKWAERLADRAKLIEPLSDGRRGGLVLLAETPDKDALKRRLIVTHWNGFKFAPDAHADLLGANLDCLLAGSFQAAVPPAPATNAPKKQPKAPAPLAKSQIITAEGIYEWDDRLLNRVCAAPNGVKLALEFESRPARFVSGAGDQTAQFMLADAAVKSLPAFDAPLDGTGFARMGIGTQDFAAASTLNLKSGARFVQAYWHNRSRWFLGLIQSANGDTLVVYAPKFTGKEKSFWNSTFDDFEEVWRSGVLPGHVLDVRVGDPKNENMTGILVLTSENNDTDRRLSFFAPNK